MEKAKLTREQAEAIQNNFNGNPHEFEGVRSWLITRHPEHTGFEKPLNELSLDAFCRALYVGYEIIEEAQEVVITEQKRQEFRELQKTPIGEADYHDGVVDTLNFFGITIKGINA